MKGTLILLCLLVSWVIGPAATAVLDPDVPSEDGHGTENSNEIQNYSTQSAPEVCQLSTCELLLRWLGTMQGNMRALETRLEASETKAVAMETRLEASETKAMAIESELQTSRSEIEQLKRANAAKVAFSATVGGHGNTGPYNVRKTLKYKNVLTNIGNAYNPSTGVFVAPVRGIYYFYFCYHASQVNRAALSLHKNDQIIATTSHHKMEDKQEPVNGSNGAALQLEVGDHVYVILQDHSWVWDGSYRDTVFTGFLVTRL